jgi:hypothetical protein
VPLVRSPVSAVLLGGIALFGGGGLYVLATSDMLSRLPASVVGRAGGCTAAAQSFSHIVFAPAIGAIVDRTHSYTHVLVGLGFLCLPGAIAWCLWAPPVASHSATQLR